MDSRARISSRKVLAKGAKSSVVINGEAGHLRLLRRIPFDAPKGKIVAKKIALRRRHRSWVMTVHRLARVHRSIAGGRTLRMAHQHPDVRRGMRYLWGGVAAGVGLALACRRCSAWFCSVRAGARILSARDDRHRLGPSCRWCSDASTGARSSASSI
jgi:hypothetical protein